MADALISEMKFKKAHRCFGRGRKLSFRPGVNLLVGEQGCGKSTVLGLLRSLGSPREFDRKDATKVVAVTGQNCRLRSFDFEKDNLRTQSYFDDNVHAQLGAMFSSHGEFVKALLQSTETELTSGQEPPTVLLFDEPDMALSPRSAMRLARVLQSVADAGHQVIAAVHNPLVIASQSHVLSLEHKKWMTSAAFLDAHTNGIDGWD